MERLLSTVAGMSILLIIAVFLAVRRSHIRVEYSTSWLGVGIAMLLLSQWPWGLVQFARLVGVTDAPVALLLIVISLFLVIFFRFSVVISDLKDANIALTQKIAILEYQVQHVEKRAALHEQS